MTASAISTQLHRLIRSRFFSELKESSLRIELEIPVGEFRAYLFDCDGTVADSMPLHYKAWKRALGRMELRLP